MPETLERRYVSKKGIAALSLAAGSLLLLSHHESSPEEKQRQSAMVETGIGSFATSRIITYELSFNTTTTTTTLPPTTTTTMPERHVTQRASRSAAPRRSVTTLPAPKTAPALGGQKVEWMNQAGIPSQDQHYVDEIFTPESGWNPGIVSKTGCIGLGQNCPDGNGNYWLDDACPNWPNDPVCQIRRFDGYAKGRYGSWAKAAQYRAAHHSW
jgi:hypothetical protein